MYELKFVKLYICVLMNLCIQKFKDTGAGSMGYNIYPQYILPTPEIHRQKAINLGRTCVYIKNFVISSYVIYI